MNLTKPIVLAASLAVLAGCEQNVQDTGALEAGIAEVKSGDFGTCYQNIHAAALALERAEKGLAHIQKVDNVHTEGTYPAAMQAVEDARAARAAGGPAALHQRQDRGARGRHGHARHAVDPGLTRGGHAEQPRPLRARRPRAAERSRRSPGERRRGTASASRREPRGAVRTR